MAVLVTGGAGYIGSHTLVELLQTGEEIIVVDNLCNSQYEAIKRVQAITGNRIKFYQIDLLNSLLLESIFIENKIDAVIHFAGLKAVSQSLSEPLSYYQNNVTGTIILCQLMKKYHVKKLVFSSSATVYGNPDRNPIVEESIVQPTNPYGRTKVMIEELLKDLYEADSDWSIALLRYFNPIGAHPSGLIGENPIGTPNNLMPYLTNVAIGKMDVLNVYRTEYSTPDGTGIRDYIHVMDLAAGHVGALNKIKHRTGVHTYNLGTGNGISVLEMIKTFEKTTGINIPYKMVQPRAGDVAISYADPTKAHNELLWSAKYDVSKMCRDAWKWQLNNPQGYTTTNTPILN